MALVSASQAAGPLSPEATTQVMPWLAAWDQRSLKKALPAAPRFLSHSVKLMLRIATAFWSTRYWAERSEPSVLEVLLEVTNWMVAFLATAPAHSTSRSASWSSAPPRSPGSVPLTMIAVGFADRPMVVRKPSQAAVPGLVRPTMPMVVSEPSSPWLYRGVRS